MRSGKSLLKFIVLVTLFIAGTSHAKDIVIYGATGTMGKVFVEEALLRGHKVTGVSRNASKFDHITWPGFTGVQGDITDIDSVREIIKGADVVIVSAHGAASETDFDPANSIQMQAAQNMVTVLREMGDQAPRVIQINGGSTLYINGVQLYHLFPRVAPEGTEGHAIMWGHHIVLDYYETIDDVKWTVLTPTPGTPFGVRGERTRRPFDVGSGNLVRPDDWDINDLEDKGSFEATYAQISDISTVDLGVALFNEIDNEDFIGERFTAWYTDTEE